MIAKVDRASHQRQSAAAFACRGWRLLFVQLFRRSGFA